MSGNRQAAGSSGQWCTLPAKVVTEVATPERGALIEATLGLALAESKMILAGVQEIMVAQQAASYITAQQICL